MSRGVAPPKSFRCEAIEAILAPAGPSDESIRHHAWHCIPRLLGERGEELRTEISTKFEPATVRAELAAAGLDVARRSTDPDGDFALWLAVR